MKNVVRFLRQGEIQLTPAEICGAVMTADAMIFATITAVARKAYLSACDFKLH